MRPKSFLLSGNDDLLSTLNSALSMPFPCRETPRREIRCRGYQSFLASCLHRLAYAPKMFFDLLKMEHICIFVMQVE